MADEELPPYVSYTNAASDALRAEVKGSIDGLRADVKGMSDVLATKAEVKLTEYKLEMETKAREEADARHAEELDELAAAVEADREERKAKGRRTTAFLWSAACLIVSTFGMAVYSLITHTN